MTYWTDSAASLYPSAGASMGDEEVGFGTRFVEAPAESARYTNLEEPTLLDDGKDWAAPLVQEWDTTKAAFLDVIHAKSSASVASVNQTFQESMARGESSLLQTYLGVTSGIASGFTNAVDGSFTGLLSLATDPVDIVQGAGRAAAASGIKYAFSDTPERLHMVASGATQLALGAAMSGAGTIKNVDLPSAESSALHDPLTRSAYAQKAAGDWADLAEFFGSAYAAEKPTLRRDFSDAMTVLPNGRIEYPESTRGRPLSHYIAGDLENGKMSYSTMASQAGGASEKLGYGSEMVHSMVRAYEKAGKPIDEVIDMWDASGRWTTNFQQFMAGRARGLTPEVAAANTFTGTQVAEFGFTNVKVLGKPTTWEDCGVVVEYRKPDWGMGAEWANYANAWVRAMGQR